MDTINVSGRTPEQSGIEAGTITPYTKTSGSGKRRRVYRVQYHDMYFNYNSHAEAAARVRKWRESGEKK
jgi:hypothetical protein